MSGPAEPDRGRPPLEVAQILRDHGEAVVRNRDQARAGRALVACRTAQLGGHLESCDSCGYTRPAYNSCRNRHCPKCQVLKQELWAEAQTARLLPVPYFHVVFTVPVQLHPLFRAEPRSSFGDLFSAVAETLSEVARRRLRVRIGFTAVLHTWTQTLLFHPHVHCVVPAGGLSLEEKKWVATGERFFLPVRVLRTVFRAKLLSKLEQRGQSGGLALPQPTTKRLLNEAARRTWVVYAKPPLAGPEQVLRYLSRYTHRIAISNYRLVGYEGGKVRFRWTDRANANQVRIMELTAPEFSRRFLQHVLPRGLVRIRHYGLFSNRSKEALARCRSVLDSAASDPAPTPEIEDDDWVAAFQRVFGSDPLRCPACQNGRLVLHQPLPSAQLMAPESARAPP